MKQGEKERKGKPRQFAPSVREGEKPSVQDYKSEDKNEVGRTKMEYTELARKEKPTAKEKSYKTPEQISDEDYKVAPTSADNEQENRA